MKMFERGMEVIRVYNDYVAEGEITSISDDADGVTLITVMYKDGAVKVYTEGAMENMLGRFMYVTHGEAGRNALMEELDIYEERLNVLKTDYLGMTV
jgi:hypothetical protein